MALDTEAKRRSAIAIGMQGWYPVSPLPDAGTSEADRMAIGWAYSGNSLGGAPPAAPDRSLILQLGGG